MFPEAAVREFSNASWICGLQNWDHFGRRIRTVSIEGATSATPPVIELANEVVFAVTHLVLQQGAIAVPLEKTDEEKLRDLREQGWVHRRSQALSQNDCLVDSLLQALECIGLLQGSFSVDQKKAACHAARQHLIGEPSLRPLGVYGQDQWDAFLQHHRHAQALLPFLIQFLGPGPEALTSAGVTLVVHARFDTPSHPPQRLPLCVSPAGVPAIPPEVHLFNWTGADVQGYCYDALVRSPTGAPAVAAAHLKRRRPDKQGPGSRTADSIHDVIVASAPGIAAGHCKEPRRAGQVQALMAAGSDTTTASLAAGSDTTTGLGDRGAMPEALADERVEPIVLAAMVPRCLSAQEHFCGLPDVDRGCTSCSLTCHKDCCNILCTFVPCPYCISRGLTTHENSSLCRDAQLNTGCHACGNKLCWTSSATCHAKCTRFRHVCTAMLSDNPLDKPCAACDAFCHRSSSDPRCQYFGRTRGHVPWSANAQELLDTQAGTGGTVAHMSQVPWAFLNRARTELKVDGVGLSKGYGVPGNPEHGEANNCLIDSLRQCLGDLQCDCRKVRRDLQKEFGNSQAHGGRAHVTHSSYLDVELHWQSILRSLLRHNTSGRSATFQPNDYCVVALYGSRPGHGVVL